MILPDPINEPKRYAYQLYLDKTECAICKSTKDLEIHRIKPREFGGMYSRDNVIVVCLECHQMIHIFIMRARPHIEDYEWVDFVKATANLREEQRKFNNGRS